ncbi:MAG: hypothetical protein ACR2MW_11085 [Chthoniobacterales bacterium]
MPTLDDYTCGRKSGFLNGCHMKMMTQTAARAKVGREIITYE